MSSRLRARDPLAQTLIEEALRRSGTIEALSRQLERSDLIVYVSTSAKLCSVRPTTALLAGAPGTRYVSIDLPMTTCRGLGQSERPVGLSVNIAWLGHELRHAVEIGDALWVRDQEGMRRLFQQIGYWHALSHGYETIAALDVQRAVAREIRQTR